MSVGLNTIRAMGNAVARTSIARVTRYTSFNDLCSRAPVRIAKGLFPESVESSIGPRRSFATTASSVKIGRSGKELESRDLVRVVAAASRRLPYVPPIPPACGST